MKATKLSFDVNCQELRKTLSITNKFIKAVNIIPDYDNTFVEIVNSKKAILYSSDLVLSVKVKLDINELKIYSGETLFTYDEMEATKYGYMFTIDSKKLIKILDSNYDGNINITFDFDKKLIIKTTKGKYESYSYVPANVPYFAKDVKHLATLKAEGLYKGLKIVANTVSNEDYSITSNALLKFNDDKLTVVSTNRYTLSEYKYGSITVKENFNMYIDRNHISFVSSLLSSYEVVNIYKGDKHIYYSVDDMFIISFNSRDDEYINYEYLLESERHANFTIDTKILKTIMKFNNGFTNEKIRLTINEDRIIFTSVNYEQALSSEITHATEVFFKDTLLAPVIIQPKLLYELISNVENKKIKVNVCDGKFLILKPEIENNDNYKEEITLLIAMIRE